MAGTSTTMELSEFPAYAEAMARGLASADYRPAWRDVALALVSDARENFDQSHGPGGQAWPALKFPRPAGGDKPLRSKGLLMASFVANGPGHVQKETPTSLEWGSNHEHAHVHQEGATIRPVRGKYLSIPLTKEASRYDSPRDFPRALFFHRGQRHPTLAESRGKGKRARVTAQYLLVQSVTIPARPMIGFHPKLLERIDNILLDRLGQAVG